MTVPEIMQLTRTEQRKHINILAAEYKRLTGRTVCKTCGGDVSFMLRYLKNLKIMSTFEFKNQSAIYRVRKGKPERISQDTLTDVKAIEYLAINKERIVLFKTYPENWEQAADQAAELIEDCCDEHTEVPCDDCMRKDLSKIKMKDLKEQYPEVPTHFGMKKAELVEAIIQLKLSEAKKS